MSAAQVTWDEPGATPDAAPQAQWDVPAPAEHGFLSGAWRGARNIFNTGKELGNDLLNSTKPVALSDQPEDQGSLAERLQGDTMLNKYVIAPAAYEKQRSLDEAVLFHSTHGLAAAGHAGMSMLHTAGEFVPGLGPMAGSLADRAVGGDPMGAIGEGIAYAIVPKVARKSIAAIPKVAGATLDLTPKRVAQGLGGVTGGVAGHGTLSAPGAYYGGRAGGNLAEGLLGEERANTNFRGVTARGREVAAAENAAAGRRAALEKEWPTIPPADSAPSIAPLETPIPPPPAPPLPPELQQRIQSTMDLMREPAERPAPPPMPPPANDAVESFRNLNGTGEGPQMRPASPEELANAHPDNLRAYRELMRHVPIRQSQGLSGNAWGYYQAANKILRLPKGQSFTTLSHESLLNMKRIGSTKGGSAMNSSTFQALAQVRDKILKEKAAAKGKR